METIKEWPVEKIKSCIYDQLVLQEQAANNIKILNEELRRRMEIEAEVVKSRSHGGGGQSTVDNKKNK